MLTMKDIIREGHPTLSKKSKDVELPLSTEDKNTLKLMMEFIENSQDPEISEQYGLRAGVGIAAPQIDVSKRMIAISTFDEKNEKFYKLLLVNPKIVSHSVKKSYITGGEGCLSVDREIEGLVPRHKKITIESHFYNIESDQLTLGTMKYTGYVSIVIQHEIDHLNGVLFVDKLFDTLNDAEPIVFIDLEDELELEERDI